MKIKLLSVLLAYGVVTGCEREGGNYEFGPAALPPGSSIKVEMPSDSIRYEGVSILPVTSIDGRHLRNCQIEARIVPLNGERAYVFGKLLHCLTGVESFETRIVAYGLDISLNQPGFSITCDMAQTCWFNEELGVLKLARLTDLSGLKIEFTD